jgi:hypothetical protein
MTPANTMLVIMLRSLKMYGLAQAVEELAQQGVPAFEAAIPVLSQLLKVETAEREVRSMAYQIKAGRFPTYCDLAGVTSPAARSMSLWRSNFIAASASRPLTISFWSAASRSPHHGQLCAAGRPRHGEPGWSLDL